MALSGASIQRVGNRTSATAAPSRNKAERLAIAESLEGKVAGMAKLAVAGDQSASKTKSTPKQKKDWKVVATVIRYPTHAILIPCTPHDCCRNWSPRRRPRRSSRRTA